LVEKKKILILQGADFLEDKKSKNIVLNNLILNEGSSKKEVSKEKD